MVSTQVSNFANQGVKPPKNEALAPPNWRAIRIRYEAGILSVRAIGREYGVTHRAILKMAAKEGWVRALAPSIQAEAERLVAKEELQQSRVGEPERTDLAMDREVTTHAAQIVAEVKKAHRGLIGRSRSLAEAMLAELAAVQNAPELFGQVHALLEVGGEDVPVALLRRVAEIVDSLPQRARTFTSLVDAMRSLIGMEREAYGMSAQDGAGRPKVTIMDFTGKGDPDAAPIPADEDEDE